VSDAYLQCVLGGGGLSAAEANAGDCGGVEERDAVNDEDEADVGRRISDDIADFNSSWIDSSAAFFAFTSAPSEFRATVLGQFNPQPLLAVAMPPILMLVLGVLIRLLASLASSLRSREEVDEEVLTVVLGLFGCVTWAVIFPLTGGVFFSTGVSAATESEGLEPKTGLPRGWESHICTRRLGPELAPSCPSTIREVGMDIAPGCL
jgi:hypothetical protein